MRTVRVLVAAGLAALALAAGGGRSRADEPPAAPGPPAAAGPPLPRWMLGAQAAVAVRSTVPSHASAIYLVAHRRLGPRLGLWGRAEWPLLASRYEIDGAPVRMWRFGALAGVDGRLAPAAVVSPHLSLALGPRAVLTDQEQALARLARVAFTPALTGATLAGARVRVTRWVRLTVEVEVAKSLALGPRARPDHELDAGDEAAARVAAGVLFAR